VGAIVAVIVAALGLGSTVAGAQAPTDATLTLVAIDFSGDPYPADSAFSLIATGPGGTIEGPPGVSGRLPAGEYQLDFRDEYPLIEIDGVLVPGGSYSAELTDCTNAPSAVESVTLTPGEDVTCTYLVGLALPNFAMDPPNVQVPATQRDLPNTGTEDPLVHAAVGGALIALGLALVRVGRRRTA
jgi:LPXTG-motif cell wall-anchored protein